MRPTIVVVAFSILFLPLVSIAQWQVDGTPLSTAVNHQEFPAIVPDGAGGAIVVWRDFRNGTNYDIYIQRVNALGVPQWTAGGAAVCVAPGNQDAPALVGTHAGGAIITWHDLRSGPANIYVQEVDALGVPQWTANGVALCTAANAQQSPTIVASGAGGAIVAWGDLRNGAGTSDVYAQQVDASGVPQWTPDGVVICSAAHDQYSPSMLADNAGGAIAVWPDIRSGTSFDIYAQRVDASGVPQWFPDGVPICIAANSQGNPTIAADGAGGAFVTWDDSRTGPSDIYAQRLNGSGVRQWAPDGVPLCIAANRQEYPRIVWDTGSGAIITWHDERDALVSDWDIYAQRIDASGVAQWTPDGVALCTASHVQQFPTIIAHGVGGAIVTWHDFRSHSSYDIYAQRVNAAGTPQWAPDGIALCTAVQDQTYPVIVSDVVGGAIVAWQDLRNGLSNSDIYALRVTQDGLIPTAVSAITPASGLEVTDAYPNPFTTGTSVDVVLREESAVTVEVFDAAGRRVRVADMGRLTAGATLIAFDGLDEHSRSLPSGVYFYRVRAGSETVTKKMVIAR